jgi:DNA polymerase-3 subunit delta'
MTFYGNNKTVSMLNRFIDRQELPQSVLLTGPTGVGKTTLALQLSMYLLCKDRADGAACGRCISCVRIQTNEHPEVAIIDPDGDLTKIWQLWTRTGHAPGALDSLSYRPVLGNWRVVIITAAHTFNDESANSILKVLEEPPTYVQFFLCSTSQSAVLPTITSRCFSVPVPPLPTQLIATMLQTDYNLEGSLAAELAKSSAGCPGRAIRAKDDADISLIRDRAEAWVSNFLQGSRSQIYTYAESLRTIVEKSSPDASARQSVTKGVQAVADAFGKQLSSSIESVEPLMECVSLSMQAAHSVQRNGNQQIVTEALVAKLSKRCHRQ